MTSELRIIPVRVRRDVRPGDDLAGLLLAALHQQNLRLTAGDILVVTHKIVSKSEGEVVPLKSVKPSAPARRWAARYGAGARLTELTLAQAQRVVRMQKGVIITETRHGLVCANSGVDLSNVDGGRSAVLLPHDPDASAARLHQELRRRLRLHVPVIITDTFGRPWREGLTEVAIGVAGMTAFRDYRGRRDPHGFKLKASIEAVADEIACAAGLACGKLDGAPAAIVRGFGYTRARGSAREMIRPAERDLFR
jgi:coenzyme F420-0:L-glutamate ligase / coenzyme F420-1:gamma-L-glutamate ligase